MDARVKPAHAAEYERRSFHFHFGHTPSFSRALGAPRFAPRMPPGRGSSPALDGGPGIDPRKRRGGRRAKRRVQSFCSRFPQRGSVAPLGAPSGDFCGAGTALFGSPSRSASGLRLRPLSGGRARKPRADSAVRRQRAPRSGSLCPRAEPRRRPGAWLAGHARGRRARPPRAGATGSRPLEGAGEEEYDPTMWRNYVLEERLCFTA